MPDYLAIPLYLERMVGIEPTFFTWKANVLPLDDIRMYALGWLTSTRQGQNTAPCFQKQDAKFPAALKAPGANDGI